jgi:hypothetical protein
MGMESFNSNQTSHEEIGNSRERYFAEAREKAVYWVNAIKSYQAKIEEYKNAEADVNGKITDKETGDTFSRTEAISGMQKLIDEAETEKTKEESKFVSQL